MTAAYYADDQITLWQGDALQVLATMPANSVNCVVTSPPYYGLRDYGEPGQYGLEASPADYVETMRQVFAEVRRMLTPDGTLWLNLGDSHVTGAPGFRTHPGYLVGRADAVTMARGFGDKSRCGIPLKNLIGIPWMTAFALREDGWILRSEIIWAKQTHKPEPVRDRFTRAHEQIFLFAKSPRYYFDVEAVQEDAADGTKRKPRDFWFLPTQPFPTAHFAVMPRELVRRCIVAGCKPGGTVLDPFCGSGTTGMVALKHGRRFVGIDLSATYLDLALRTRLSQGALIDDVTTLES